MKVLILACLATSAFASPAKLARANAIKDKMQAWKDAAEAAEEPTWLQNKYVELFDNHHDALAELITKVLTKISEGGNPRDISKMANHLGKKSNMVEAVVRSLLKYVDLKDRVDMKKEARAARLAELVADVAARSGRMADQIQASKDKAAEKQARAVAKEATKDGNFDKKQDRKAVKDADTIANNEDKAANVAAKKAEAAKKADDAKAKVDAKKARAAQRAAAKKKAHDAKKARG